jgi:ent-kaurene oxidase
MLGHYSMEEYLGSKDVLTRTIRRKLNDKKLPELFDDLKDEVHDAINTELPQCNHWTRVNLNSAMKHIVARVFSRIQLGKTLSRDQTWLSASLMYTESSMTTVAILRLIPAFLHPLVSILLPSTWQARHYLSVGKGLILSSIQQREIALESSENPEATNFLEWMMEDLEKKAHSKLGEDREVRTPSELANRVLMAGRAAIHTTAIAAVNTIYDTCEDGYYFEALREERRKIVAEKGDTYAALGEQKLMDSCMKESLRLNPPLMRKLT